jgi:hypothetical protein
MSDDKPKSKKRLAFTAAEVKRFFVEAQNLFIRADSILSDHYTGKNAIMSRITLNRVHELLVDSYAFEEMLREFFPLGDGRVHYEIDVQSVLHLSKITSLLNSGRAELLKVGISVETQ